MAITVKQAEELRIKDAIKKICLGKIWYNELGEYEFRRPFDRQELIISREYDFIYKYDFQFEDEKLYFMLSYVSCTYT